MGSFTSTPSPPLHSGTIDPGDLFAEVTSVRSLEAAWAKVKANDGAAGGDGISLRAFEIGAPRRIAHLSEALSCGQYRPGPLRHVDIPKPAGGLRGLSIPCVVDRVAQTSAHAVLSPILDAEFEPTSFAYRPGLGVADAVRRVAALRDEGFAWLLDADIEAFFDNVPHEKLIARLGESLPDGPLTNLVSLWITHAAPVGRGLPQGSPISPLLANLYLDRADEALQGKGPHGSRLRLVRFADDFVILARDRGGAEAALALASRVLGDLGLSLNREKTRVVSFDQGFRFLGHLFVRSLVMKTGPVESDMARLEADLAAIARSDKVEEAHARKAEGEEETRRAAGLATAFRVLYLRSADRRLGVRNTAFSVQEGSGAPGAVQWREILAIPHQDVDRIEIYPGTEILPEALRHAMAHDVQVAFVNGHGETLGAATSTIEGRAARHLAQAATVLDLEKRLRLAALIVDGRLRNQRGLLRRLGRNRADGADAVAVEGLNDMIRKAPHATTLAELMGHEGHGGALYWPALSACLGHGFTLAGRDRRPPPDPANLVLNFLCGLLARDIAVAIGQAGLHPGFGVLHATSERREAAVYDLMEEFRAPMTESVMVYLFNNRVLGRANFSQAPNAGAPNAGAAGGVTIDRAGGDRLIRAYEAAAERVVGHPITNRRGSWRTMMVQQAFAYAAHVEGRTVYQPMILNY